MKPLASHMMKPKDSSLAWFDPLYQEAQGDPTKVPWARQVPHPELISWLKSTQWNGAGQRALVVGCGLGDDAEALAQIGFDVVAFDLSSTAIKWCHQRFPKSKVYYQVGNLFEAPAEWHDAFDFVLEIYTIQALPLALRTQTIRTIASFVRPQGRALIVCHGRNEKEQSPAGPPWPLSIAELSVFRDCGLQELSFEQNKQTNTETETYYRILYQRS